MNITIITIITFITVILLNPSAALAATLGVSPSKGTLNKSCSFTVTVDLDTQGAQTDGTDAILVFDPARLNATSILNGTIYSDYPGSNIDTTTGRITVSGLASVNSPFSGKGTLATIHFTILETALAGATALSFDFDPNDKAKTTDSNVVERGTVSDVLSSVGNGSYTIGTGSCLASAGSGSRPPQGAPGGVATPSAGAVSPEDGSIPGTTLPPAGSETFTMTLAIVGSVLTILGILGLAVL